MSSIVSLMPKRSIMHFFKIRFVLQQTDNWKKKHQAVFCNFLFILQILRRHKSQKITI